MKLLFLLVSLAFAANYQVNAQSQTTSNLIIFSSIKGQSSKPATFTIPINLGVKVNSVQLNSSGKENFEIVSFTKPMATNGNVLLKYKPAADFTGIQTASLALLSAKGKLLKSITLTGLSTNGLEGENEAPLAQIVDALGYKINVGWTSLANHCKPALQGEEIAPALFHKAKKGNVEMIPVARYSPDFLLPFGYYTTLENTPVKHEVGVLAKSGVSIEHQVVFPALDSGNTTFDPGSTLFGFFASGPTHSAYSQDVWNIALHSEYAAHATRIYPVRTKSGKLLPHTYLVCFEEAKNGDYNDYMFLVKNVVPVKISTRRRKA